jgi:hypothetical protein
MQQAVLVGAWIAAICVAATHPDGCVLDDPSVCARPPAEAPYILALLTPLLLAATQCGLRHWAGLGRVLRDRHDAGRVLIDWPGGLRDRCCGHHVLLRHV